MKRSAERTRSAESDIERDLGNGRAGICQQGLCAFDPPPRPVTIGRLSEGLLEGSQKMIRALSHKISQHAKGNVLRKVRLHEIHDPLSLPTGKPATVGGP